MGSCINKSKKPVDQEKEIANSERKANNDHLYKPAEAGIFSKNFQIILLHSLIIGG